MKIIFHVKLLYGPCLILAFSAGCATARPATREPVAKKVLITVTKPPHTVTPIPPTLEPLAIALTQQAQPDVFPKPTSTPGPKSCDEVAGICLKLTFDGESCIYQGPTDLKTGNVSLLFINESEENAGVNLVRHTGDKTIQDMLDYIGEEPSGKHHPSWSWEIVPAGIVRPGGSSAMEAFLFPEIHSMFCVRFEPLGVWFGTGLTVGN